MVEGHELRTDVLGGHRVVVAPGRAARPGAGRQLDPPEPGHGADTCPFCDGREHETPPELYATGRSEREPDTPGWQGRLVPNKFPAFGSPHAVATSELFPAQAAIGAQDVLVHTPQHRLSLVDLEAETLAEIAAAWSWRANAGLVAGTVYSHVVVNEGAAAGASLPHSHSQIFSLPFAPPSVAGELGRQAASSPCLSCQIIEAELRDGGRVVARRGGLLAYCAYAGRFPYETVVTPIECEDDAFASSQLAGGLELAVDVLAAVRRLVGWAPANLWLTTSPHVGGRTHWRLTVAPRLTTTAGLELGAEISVNPLAPEVAAVALRAQGGL